MSNTVASIKIRVDGSTWSIKFVKKAPSWWKDGVVGECVPREKAIYILASLSPVEATRTLAHEVFHAVLYKWNREILTTQVQEDIAVTLTTSCHNLRNLADRWLESDAKDMAELLGK